MGGSCSNPKVSDKKTLLLYDISRMTFVRKSLDDSPEFFFKNRNEWNKEDSSDAIIRVTSIQASAHSVTIPDIDSSDILRMNYSTLEAILKSTTERAQALDDELQSLFVDESNISNASVNRSAIIMEDLSRLYKEYDEALFLTTQLQFKSVSVYDPLSMRSVRYLITDAIQPVLDATNLLNEADTKPFERSSVLSAEDLPQFHSSEEQQNILQDYTQKLAEATNKRDQVVAAFQAAVANTTDDHSLRASLIAMTQNNEAIDTSKYIINKLSTM